MGKLWTIGCSTETTPQFIARLQRHNIDAIVDVRSLPYSKYTPHFNKEILAAALKLKKIYYLWFGQEFGARRNEGAVYENGKVNFAKVIDLNIFRQAVTRIVTGLKNMNIALMCSEKDPINCHRFSLVAHGIYLLTKIEATHILIDGSLENAQALENRVVNELNIGKDLFHAEEHLPARAYREINWHIAASENIMAKII